MTRESLCAWITDVDARDRYRKALDRSDLRAMLDYYRRNFPRPPYRESTWPRVKARVPVLMIHGLDDPFLLPGALDGTRDWVQEDLTQIPVPGAGHWVHHDATELVTKSIRDWLAHRSAVP